MDQASWQIASSISDIVMAITGIAAAIYGLSQYRASVRISEVEFLTDLHKTMSDFLRYAASTQSEENRYNITLEALDKFEFYLMLADQKFVTRRTAKYITNSIRIEGSENDLKEELVPILKSILNDKRADFPLLVEAMKKSELRTILSDPS